MMGGNVLLLSMISAACAFLGTVFLIHVVDFILQRLGIDIWTNQQAARLSSSPLTNMSNEDKEKIETLRSSAIIRHLEKYTTSLNDNDMVATTSNAQEKASVTCSSIEKVGGEEEIEQSDIENGANDNDEDEEQYSHIRVPLPGKQATCCDTNKSADEMIPEGTRNVPNICVICHEDYNISDEVCWSSNQECIHVFHKDCMVSWLTSLGWMKLKEQKESKNMMLEDKCLDYYDLECPVCRSQFICKDLLHKNVRAENANNINV